MTNSGRLYGLEEDLNMHGNQYQTAVSLLFVTYILSEVGSQFRGCNYTMLTEKASIESCTQKIPSFAMDSFHCNILGYCEFSYFTSAALSRSSR
jgi:hypothetical protein